LGTLEAHSTARLKRPLASERAAETWKAPVDALREPHVHSIGMASDPGPGPRGGLSRGVPRRARGV